MNAANIDPLARAMLPKPVRSGYVARNKYPSRSIKSSTPSKRAMYAMPASRQRGFST